MKKRSRLVPTADPAPTLIKIARIHSDERIRRVEIGALVLVVGLTCMMLRADIAWPVAAALGIIEGGIVLHDPDRRRERSDRGSGS